TTGHYFSSHIAQPLARGLTRDSGFFVRLTLPTVVFGQTSGALRFVSLALHVLSQGRKAPQVRFSEECFRTSLPFGNPVSLKLDRYSLHTRPQKSRGTLQAWMNSRNESNITSRSKHRQLVLLHPIFQGRILF